MLVYSVHKQCRHSGHSDVRNRLNVSTTLILSVKMKGNIDYTFGELSPVIDEPA